MATIRSRYQIGTQEPTRYEVVLEQGDYRSTLGFTRRTGRMGLYGYVDANRDRIIGRLGTDADSTRLVVTGGALKCRITMGSVIVRFSGRTERECASDYDRAYVGRLAYEQS